MWGVSVSSWPLTSILFEEVLKQVWSKFAAGLRPAFDMLSTCLRHAHASLRPGLQPGLQLARIMECGLYFAVLMWRLKGCNFFVTMQHYSKTVVTIVIKLPEQTAKRNHNMKFGNTLRQGARRELLFLSPLVHDGLAYRYGNHEAHY